MRTLKAIKKRINSINCTMKITSAMKLISAARLKDVQDAATRSRLYNKGIKEVALEVVSRTGEITHPAFVLRKKMANVRLMVVTPERGFCGSLAEQVSKQVSPLLEMMKDRDILTKVTVIGKKGAQYFRKQGMDFERIDLSIEDPFAGLKIENLCFKFLNSYLSGDIDQLLLMYVKFLSIATHEIALDVLLPVWVKKENMPGGEDNVDFIYEPGKGEVLELLLQKALRTAFYQTLLEVRAAELSARVIAMDKASKNAEEMLKGLVRRYNSVRQATITRELLDIISGAEAIKR